MQRTEKYFEQDAFRTQCESIILAAEPDEKTGGGRIALDGTDLKPFEGYSAIETPENAEYGGSWVTGMCALPGGGFARVEHRSVYLAAGRAAAGGGGGAARSRAGAAPAAAINSIGKNSTG